LSEKYRLRVFEYKVLRKLFQLMKDVVTGEWRELHNEQLKGQYCATNIVRVIKWRRMISRACRACGEEERRIQVFGRKT
jgi:di/tripeptidase